MRLDKFLTETGLGTRKEVKKIIDKGDIKVNGEKIYDSGFAIDEKKDNVKYMDKIMHFKSIRCYVMNKPAGVITATEDENQKTVMDILPEWVIKKNLIPVGRLDKDTEGVLLLTNDGKLAHNLLSPVKHVSKVYYAVLKESIKDEDIQKLQNGVEINEGYITKEAFVEKITDKEIYLTITEGKYHQVKEMLKSVNNEVVYLKRVKFGNIELGDLKKGDVLEIDADIII